MNLNQIAEAYGTTVEQYVDGEWITVEVETTEVEVETTEVEVETTEVEKVFMSEMTTIKTTKSGPAKIIASLRSFGFTIQRIADLVGVSTSAVYRWARVENWPLDHNYNNLLKVAGSI